MKHFLVTTLPLQSYINPILEFARRLSLAGARVTFVSSVSAYRHLIESPPPEGISYASFSDGHDDGFKVQLNTDSSKVTLKESDSASNFGEQFHKASARKITELVCNLKGEGCPITCIVYTFSQTWAADLAHELQILAVPLWLQPVGVLAIYYHYFHGYDCLIDKIETDPEFLLELPKLPPLDSKDVPTLLLPSDPHSVLREGFRKQFKTFDKDMEESGPKPQVLVNTFEALEREAIASIDPLDLICIGPLISSSPRKPTSYYYMEWLGSRPVSSVVYISFGSILSPGKRRMEEILNGLLEARRPFLWVIKESEKRPDAGSDDEFWSRVNGCEEGLVVPWCSQVEVLAHPSTGCFLTHCGWNSTLESMAMGIPLVCFPLWMDQMTTAKMVEDVWKTGVRVKVNEDGMLEGGELRRCLEEVMGGERGEEMKKNAKKWKVLASETVREGGPSDLNVRAFVE